MNSNNPNNNTNTPGYYENRYKTTVEEIFHAVSKTTTSFFNKLDDSMNVLDIKQNGTLNKTQLLSNIRNMKLSMINDVELKKEIAATTTRTYEELDNVLKLSAQSYGMFITISNAKKTKFSICVPSYVSFLREVFIDTISYILMINDTKDISNVTKINLKHILNVQQLSLNTHLKSEIESKIMEMVPLSNVIKKDFDSISVCEEFEVPSTTDEEEEEEKREEDLSNIPFFEENALQQKLSPLIFPNITDQQIEPIDIHFEEDVVSKIRNESQKLEETIGQQQHQTPKTPIITTINSKPLSTNEKVGNETERGESRESEIKGKDKEEIKEQEERKQEQKEGKHKKEKHEIEGGEEQEGGEEELLSDVESINDDFDEPEEETSSININSEPNKNTTILLSDLSVDQLSHFLQSIPRSGAKEVISYTDWKKIQKSQRYKSPKTKIENTNIIPRDTSNADISTKQVVNTPLSNPHSLTSQSKGSPQITLIHTNKQEPVVLSESTSTSSLPPLFNDEDNYAPNITDLDEFGFVKKDLI
jgi:hypothetical protein